MEDKNKLSFFILTALNILLLIMLCTSTYIHSTDIDKLITQKENLIYDLELATKNLEIANEECESFAYEKGKEFADIIYDNVNVIDNLVIYLINNEILLEEEDYCNQVLIQYKNLKAINLEIEAKTFYNYYTENCEDLSKYKIK